MTKKKKWKHKKFLFLTKRVLKQILLEIKLNSSKDLQFKFLKIDAWCN